MVWAGFRANVITLIVSIRSRMNSESHIDMIKKVFPDSSIITGDDYLHQKHNTSCCVSWINFKLRGSCAQFLDLLSINTDLNPTENLWDFVFVKTVRKHDTQYLNTDNFTSFIELVWKNFLNKLYLDFQNQWLYD